LAAPAEAPKSGAAPLPPLPADAWSALLPSAAPRDALTLWAALLSPTP